MRTSLDHLRKRVQAACGECDMAMIFYAPWRTAIDDQALHNRLGVSYSTNAFRAVVTALRREILMALLRIWDPSSGAVNMVQIIAQVREAKTIKMLAEARGTSIRENMITGGDVGAPVDAIIEQVRETLDDFAEEFLQLAAKYSPGGVGENLLKRLKTLRNERLAHFSVQASAAPEKNASDQEIDEFFSDNTKIVQVLRRLVLGEFFDPIEAVDAQQHYARLFWASVRGERTEGHPSYRPPPQ